MQGKFHESSCVCGPALEINHAHRRMGNVTVTILNAHPTLELNYMYIGKKVKCPKLCAHVSYVTMDAAILYVIIMFMIAQEINKLQVNGTSYLQARVTSSYSSRHIVSVQQDKD